MTTSVTNNGYPSGNVGRSQMDDSGTDTVATGSSAKTSSTGSIGHSMTDIIQTFDKPLPFDNSLDYSETSDQPKLPRPDAKIGDGTITPSLEGSFKTPYNQHERRMILEKFTQSLESSLKEQMESSGYTASSLDTLLEQYVTWKKQENSEELSPEITKLLSSAEKEAVAKTAKQYGLPSTWTPDVKKSDSWTPVEKKGIDPVKFQNEIVTSSLETSTKTLSQAKDVAKTILDQLPPEHPDRLELTEFLKTISKAIQALKEFLFYKQSQDAKAEKDAAMMRLGLTQDQCDVRNLQMDNIREMHMKQKTMGQVGLAMKIITPILSVGLIVAGAATSWFFGAGLLLIAVGALIGVAATAYSIVDSCTNCTSKIFDAFDQLIGKIVTAAFDEYGLDNDAQLKALCKELGIKSARDFAKEAIKFAIIGVAVAALAIVILASPGTGVSGAANIAAQSSAQIIKQLLISIAKQISLQLIMQIVTPAVSKSTMPLLKASGTVELLAKLFKTDSEKVSMGLEMALTVLATLVLMGIAVKAGKDMGQIAESTQKWGKALTPVTKFEMLMKRLTSTEQADVKSVGNFIGRVSQALELGQVGVKATTSVIQAVQHFQMAAILEKKADLEGAEQALAGMIAILSKLLNEMQSTLGSEGQFITSLTNTQKEMFKGASISISGLFSQA